ncbi:hypothetical protein E2C01_060603 [Portunus trituberculatus]|uniref:Uncharacterized protein n=1 Tax=Portunus trituberculatus TaxID=210409 RepID=A0A5B7H9X2_PORTR|nr:hypothetical protein [Portunus trituberculatus]
MCFHFVHVFYLAHRRFTLRETFFCSIQNEVRRETGAIQEPGGLLVSRPVGSGPYVVPEVLNQTQLPLVLDRGRSRLHVLGKK